jgi:hypothetical protein
MQMRAGEAVPLRGVKRTAAQAVDYLRRGGEGDKQEAWKARPETVAALIERVVTMPSYYSRGGRTFIEKLGSRVVPVKPSQRRSGFLIAGTSPMGRDHFHLARRFMQWRQQRVLLLRHLRCDLAVCPQRELAFGPYA